MLECPITGGLEALKKGQMAVWVGGDPEAYKIQPVTIKRQDSLDKKINSLQDLRTSLFYPVQDETIFLEPLDLQNGKSRTSPATPIAVSQ